MKLQIQPFQVLAMLLSRPGEVVTREELQRALWPTGTFVEFDQGINTAIRKIRYVLDDTAENPRFIETVPRRGYRFVAPVDRSAEAPVPGADGSPAPHNRPTVRTGLAAAAIALFGVAAFVVDTSRPVFREPYTALPVTTLPGNERDPSFSPDGQKIVFAWDRGTENDSNLYIKHIGAEALTQLTRGEGDDRSPAWSPDGRSIAFVRYTPTSMLVLVVPAIGGAETILVNTSVWPDARMWYSMSYLAWTSDSKWLIAPENDETGERIGLTAISMHTGERRALTRPSAQWLADLNPVVSPDSKVLYFVRLASVVAGDLHALPMTDNLQPIAPPQRHRIGDGLIGNLVWGGDTQDLVFPMWDRANLWRIYRLPNRRPEKVRLLASLGENARYLAISKSAKRLVLSRAHQDQDVWRVNLHARSRPRIQDRTWSARHEFITSTVLDRNAHYSPDGTKIVFQSARSGAPEIWLADSDGSNAVQLTFLKARTTGFPSWSPDGRQIALHSRVNPQGDIFIIQTDGRNLRQLTRDEEEDVCPRWSRDGRSIYFASHRTGRYEMWKVSAQGGEAAQVTTNGGGFGFESPDKRYLYYSKYGGPELWRIALDSGREERVEQVALSNDTAWDVTSRGIWFIGVIGPRAPQTLNVLRFATGAVEPITRIPAAVDFGLSISPDERSALYSQLDRPTSDLVLVEPFP